MRILLALALALSAVTARAQATEVPRWFPESFLEFPQDVKEAARDGKRLMLYFWQDNCPYCKSFVEGTLADPAIVEKTQRHFVPVALNTWGARDVEWMDGRRTNEKALAELLTVRGTPTVIFLDEKGAPVLRLAGTVPRERFAQALEEARGR
jgi:thioredoxin-related protein